MTIDDLVIGKKKLKTPIDFPIKTRKDNLIKAA